MTPEAESGKAVRHEAGRWLRPDTGDAVDHAVLMDEMAGRRVVLLGETHYRYDIHRWQLHVAAGLHARRGDIALGFEMFPRRVQPVLDEWVAGVLETDAFLEKVEWKTVWGFEPELYLPLFHFCREMRLPMHALNCRRPLVTEVGKQGWDAIAEEDRDGLTPSKPATSAYRRYLFDIVSNPANPNRGAKSPDDPAFDRFVRAQQTWDRAFACNIARAVAGPDAPLMVGIIGRGHLEYGHGTPYQLDDLGVDGVSVLLPSDDAFLDPAEKAGIAEAVFRLDRPEKAVRPRGE